MPNVPQFKKYPPIADPVTAEVLRQFFKEDDDWTQFVATIINSGLLTRQLAMTVQLVELVSSPLDELRPLVVAYGREVPQDPAAAHPDNVLQEFTRLMGSPYVLVLAARDGERTVGYAVAQLMHDPTDDAICVLIRHAYLAPGYRRRGIVWQGLQAIHAWASRH